jgi:hypothetical protein
MMKKVKIILVPVIAIAFLGIVLFSYAQEQVTITTYYPAPFGVYANLSVTDQLKMMTLAGAPVVNAGPGIWLTPPVPNQGAVQIVSYSSGGQRGLRMVFYGTAAAADVNLFGHYAAGVFSGLYVRGDNQAYFTNDLTVNRDLYVLRDVYVTGSLRIASLRLNRVSQQPILGGVLSDPISEGGGGLYLLKMSYWDKDHIN